MGCDFNRWMQLSKGDGGFRRAKADVFVRGGYCSQRSGACLPAIPHQCFLFHAIANPMRRDNDSVRNLLDSRRRSCDFLWFEFDGRSYARSIRMTASIFLWALGGHQPARAVASLYTSAPPIPNTSSTLAQTSSTRMRFIASGLRTR